jgi:P-type E1-E2 ATPase
MDYVAGLKSVKDEFGDLEREEVNKKIAFKTVCSKLKVLARCTPTVKHLLVTGLKEDNTVAIIGKSYNDIDIVKTADVGICLGKRPESETLKNHSDIVLIDDSF